MSDDGRMLLMFLMLGGCLSMPGSLGTMITLLIFSVGLYFDLKDEFPFLWYGKSVKHWCGKFLKCRKVACIGYAEEAIVEFEVLLTILYFNLANVVLLALCFFYGYEDKGQWSKDIHIVLATVAGVTFFTVVSKRVEYRVEFLLTCCLLQSSLTVGEYGIFVSESFLSAVLFFAAAAGVSFLVGSSLVQEIKTKTMVEVLPFQDEVCINGETIGTVMGVFPIIQKNGDLLLQPFEGFEDERCQPMLVHWQEVDRFLAKGESLAFSPPIKRRVKSGERNKEGDL